MLQCAKCPSCPWLGQWVTRPAESAPTDIALALFEQVVRGSANYRFASHLRLGRGEVWYDRGLAM